MKPLKPYLAFLICLITALVPMSAPAADWVPPSTHNTNFTAGTHIGVPGGFERFLPGGANQRTTIYDVTAAPYNADDTGATDASVAINAAITAAWIAGGTNNRVFIPAGTYRIENPIILNGSLDYHTIAGAGSGVTTLVLYGSSSIAVGTGADYLWDYLPADVTGNPVKGATTLTVDDASNIIVGNICQLALDNIATTELLVFTPGGPFRSQKQKFRVTAKDGNTLTIFPPLLFDAPESRNPTIVCAGGQAEFVGVEGMTIDASNTSSTAASVSFQQAYGCWAYDIEIIEPANYQIGIGDSLQCQIRRIYGHGAQGGGSNRAGLIMGASSSCLLEDSIFADIGPAGEINAGCSGNAFVGLFGNNIFNTNHGAHNSYNLYEACWFFAWQSDGYFGGSGHDTVLRCSMPGQDPGYPFDIPPFIQNRFTRETLVVGCVFGNAVNGLSYSYGNPNLGNGSSDGEASLINDDPWIDLNLSGEIVTRTSDSEVVVDMVGIGALVEGQGAGNNGPSLYWSGGRRLKNVVVDITGNLVTFGLTGFVEGDVFPTVGTEVTVWTGSAGFQELDLDVQNTTRKVKNFISNGSGGGSIEFDTADVIPASLVYASGYPWWDDTAGFSGTHPAVNPAAPNYSKEIIPAGYRFINGSGSPPPNGSGNATATTATAGSLSIGAP